MEVGSFRKNLARRRKLARDGAGRAARHRNGGGNRAGGGEQLEGEGKYEQDFFRHGGTGLLMFLVSVLPVRAAEN